MEANELDPITRMVQAIADYGVLIVIAGIVLVFGTVFCWTIISLVRKYGPMIAESVVTMIESLRKCNEANTRYNETNTRNFECVSDTCRAMNENLSMLSEAVAQKMDPRGDPKYKDHVFSTASTNAAIKQALVGAKHAVEHGDVNKAVPYLEHAIQALE